MTSKILKETYTYADLQIVPKEMTIRSRKDVDLTTKIGNSKANFHLAVPIMGASMDSICGSYMAKTLAEAGAMGVIHRYQTVDQRLEELRKVPAGLTVGVSVGLDDSFEDCARLSKHAKLLNVDVAYAYSSRVIDYVGNLVKYMCDGVVIMAGNVCTYEGVLALARTGAHVIKLNVGSGSSCSTRIMTGVGLGSMTVVFDARDAIEKNNLDVSIIADGGLRQPSDIAKALGAGADACMVGGMIAATFECPTDLVTDEKGNKFKSFRGMASKGAQQSWKGLKPGIVPEGVEVMVPYKGSVVPIIEQIKGGLRSSMTYVGAQNLDEFYQKVEFVKVTSNGVIEASPHVLANNGVKPL